MKSILKEIEIKSEYIGNGEWLGLTWRSDRWWVTISRGDNKITVDFYLGEVHRGRAPGFVEVLYVLLNNYRAGQNSFEDFCATFGYDTESRMAFATWEECKKHREKLGELLSPEEIAQLEIEFADY